MESQTITQTINLLVAPGTPNTGFGPTDSQSPLLPLAIVATLLITSFLAWYFLLHKPHRPNPISKSIAKLLPKLGIRGFSIFVILTLLTVMVSHLPIVSAAPSLSLGTDQNTISVTVPMGGGTASAKTTLTSGTANTSGYTMTASLTEPEPGISIKLKGGDVTSSTALNAGDTPLTLKTTSTASSGDSTEVTLDFTIDGSVSPGTKDLKLNYAVTDNAVATIQSFTTSQCADLPTYTGTNEEAVVTLHDPRGEGQDYQVAKLADGNCWMLNNLKLGSTTGTLTLTPSDTNIASNFTLPQLTTGGDLDYDNPVAYGPVPGDTGSGETNYGYLYNWPAATAGESRTSHDETDGDAPFSLCPANWRLPSGRWDETFTNVSGDYPSLDQAFGGTGEYAGSGEPNIAKWQHDGPFKGVFSGAWVEGFVLQGGIAYLWSRSAFPGNVGYAVFASFNAGEVSPGSFAPRGGGLAVRCLLGQLP